MMVAKYYTLGVQANDGSFTTEPVMLDMDTKPKVTVMIEMGSRPNTWDVTIDPVTAGMQRVRIFLKDSFGAESETFVGDFVAHVNTTPSLAPGGDMEDRRLLRGVSASATHEFTIRHHFDGLDALDDTTVTPAVRDAECSISTSPAQPTSYAGGGTGVDPAISTATPTAGDMALIRVTRDDTDNYVTTVSVDAQNSGPADATGQFTLTITCEDGEVSVSDDAVITVRP